MRRYQLVAALVLVVGLSSSAHAAVWKPKPGVSWQWQLQGTIDTSVKAHVYDIDGFDNSKKLVEKLHDKGRRVVCYISAGSWENWRRDADDFPGKVLGNKLDGWAGERWLDIRERDILRPIMRERIEMCAAKGFDAMEFDNVDGYSNSSGFNLSGVDQLAYNRMLARIAHNKGLSAALKNDVDQVNALEEDFDFAINEECFNYDECGKLSDFIDADKAVLHVEYELPRSEFCDEAKELDFSSLKKRWSLGAWRRPC
jgi:hypothetical protein